MVGGVNQASREPWLEHSSGEGERPDKHLFRLSPRHDGSPRSGFEGGTEQVQDQILAAK